MSSTYLAASFLLLLLSLLYDAAQGIRLENGMKPVGQQPKTLFLQQMQAEGTPVIIEEGFKKTTLICRDGDRNSGKNRKLLTATAPSPTTAITGNENDNPISKEFGKHSANEKDVSNNILEPISEILTETLEHYPDLVHMDYAPARRKPPIHN